MVVLLQDRADALELAAHLNVEVGLVGRGQVRGVRIVDRRDRVDEALHRLESVGLVEALEAPRVGLLQIRSRLGLSRLEALGDGLTGHLGRIR